MNITVIGDALLDVDITGTAQRLSPDAPVPVVDVQKSVERAGGAGLVARMLACDGHQVELVTLLSQDADSARLLRALEGIKVTAGKTAGTTSVKTRIRAASHPVVRFDTGAAGPFTVTEDMLAAIRTADAILVADYGRGLLSDPTIRAAISEQLGRVPVVWDPHPSGAVPIAHFVTPNQVEAAQFSGIPGQSLSAAAQAGQHLRSLWDCDGVIVTVGDQGAVPSFAAPVTTSGVPFIVPATAVTTDDPCGAGDRLAATFLGQILSGNDPVNSLMEAVRAASVFVLEGGVETLGQERRAPGPQPFAEALEVAKRTRSKGEVVVATGGCFDLLHAGHVRTLAAARAMGGCLIVCMNSDSSVRRLKGPDRPIISQQDRVALLLALECVDAVMVFDQETPQEALEQLRPDLWVKGGDYQGSALPESKVMAQWGGATVIVPYVEAHSTSNLATALTRISS